MSGRIVTFYSYKGGSGRSMALANVAWILATHGKRVLAIDWDLEAPGLHRYFQPLLGGDPEAKKNDGLIDRLWQHVELLLKPRDEWPAEIEDPFALADPATLAIQLELPPKAGGTLHFISAGKQTAEYAAHTQGFDWTAFYERFGGRQFIARFREKLVEAYDVVLVDSRTGITDTSGICTIDLPDTVIHCLVHNRQSVLGAAAAAESIQLQQPEGRTIQQYPVPMRVEKNVPDFEGNRQFLEEHLNAFLPGKMSKAERERHWAEAEILYRARYAGGEILAAFIDLPDERNTLFSDMVWLAHMVSGEKTLKPVRLTDEQRETYRRTVALRDPRIAELAAVAQDSENAYPKLMQWLEQLRRDGEDTPGWIERLTQSSLGTAKALAALGQGTLASQIELEAIEILREINEHRRGIYSATLAGLLLDYVSRITTEDQWGVALPLARECVDLYRNLSQDHEGRYREELGVALVHMAKGLLEVKNFLEAERCASESVEVLRSLSREKNRWNKLLAYASICLAQAKNGLGKNEESINCFVDIFASAMEAKDENGNIDPSPISIMSVGLMNSLLSNNLCDQAAKLGASISTILEKMYKKMPSETALQHYTSISILTARAEYLPENIQESLKSTRKLLRIVRNTPKPRSPFMRDQIGRLIKTYLSLSKEAGTRIDRKLLATFEDIKLPDQVSQPTPTR